MIFTFEKQTKKNLNYAILNFKCSAKKTTGQWTDMYVQGDQRVNGVALLFLGAECLSWFDLVPVSLELFDLAGPAAPLETGCSALSSGATAFLIVDFYLAFCYPAVDFCWRKSVPCLLRSPGCRSSPSSTGVLDNIGPILASDGKHRVREKILNRFWSMLAVGWPILYYNIESSQNFIFTFLLTFCFFIHIGRVQVLHY